MTNFDLYGTSTLHLSIYIAITTAGEILPAILVFYQGYYGKFGLLSGILRCFRFSMWDNFNRIILKFSMHSTSIVHVPR